MPKLRVYQLARELNRDNAEIIRELQHMGVPVTSHSNTVEDRLADRLRRELGVFSAEGGKKRAPAGDDDIVAVDVPDEEVAVTEPPAAEPEPPRVEAKAEPKPEPKIEEKAPEPKVAAPHAPVPSTPVAAPAAPPAPQAPPPAPPKVEQPVAAQPPQPPKPLTTPSGGRIIPPPVRIGPAVPPILPTQKVEPPAEQRKTMQQIALDKARRDHRLPPPTPNQP